MAQLQEQATAQSQEQAILQRALQDKTAQVEVELMSIKVRGCSLREEGEEGPGRGLWARCQGGRLTRKSTHKAASFSDPADGAESGSGGQAEAGTADSLC